MAKKKLNKNWLHAHMNDPYVQLAQKEGYRARAAYKLKEIDELDKLIKPGQIIVDLGSVPGSWSQYARNKLTGKDGSQIHGMIIGLDILPMEPITDVHFIQGDFRDTESLQRLDRLLEGRKVDLVLSDMAPNLSGIAISDASRVEEIIDLVIEFAQQHMKPSGTLLAKCFNGTGYNEVLMKFRQEFKTVASRKPRASRDKSSEIFLLGKILQNPR